VLCWIFKDANNANLLFTFAFLLSPQPLIFTRTKPHYTPTTHLRDLHTPMRQCNRFMQPSTFVPLRIRFKFSNLPALPTSYFHFSIAGNFNLFLLYPCKMENPVIGAQVQFLTL